MADKKAPEPTYIEIDGEQLETAEVEFRGTTYTMRELTVGENEEVDKGAKTPDGTYDGNLLMKLAITKSIISPPTDADDLQKWGGKKYLVISRLYNRLNSLPEGNA